MTLKTLAVGALLAVLALDQPAAASTARADGCRGPLERWTEKVAAVVDRYKRRFRQQRVARTEQTVCLAFD